MPRRKRIRGRKILYHPNKDEIIRRLSRGESLDTVEKWLNSVAKKNGKNNLKISRKTLQEFRKEQLGLDKSVLSALQDKRAAAIVEQEKKRVKTMLASSEAYQEALADVSDHVMDKEKRLKQFDKILESQIGYIIKIIDEAVYSEDYTNLNKSGNLLIKYIEQARGLLQDYNKMIEKEPDSRTEHIVSINVVQDEIIHFRNAVIDVLREMEPSLQNIFLEKLETRWSTDGSVKKKDEKQLLIDTPYKEVIGGKSE